jgi:hypothetical protein
MILTVAFTGFTLLAMLKDALWHLPPGTAIAILALVTGVVSVLPQQYVKQWLRTVIVVLSLLLVVTEIIVLTHSRDEAVSDRRAQDVMHRNEMKELWGHFTFVEQTLGDLRVNNARGQSTLSPTSLKRRALDLSDEILQFLVNRQISPGYGQGGFGEGGFGGTATEDESYQKETVTMFSSAFQGRVTAIRDALAKQGLTDSRLDTEYANPVNAYSIRTIAERIGALAERLP